MNVIRTALSDVLIIEPKVIADSRGFFYESYNKRLLIDKAGITAEFVQDNHSRSGKNVLRGLHYQIKQPQGKLVRVIEGSAFDVTVDIRKYSPTFGKWVGFNLTSENKRMVWIPPGFAHGFLTLSDSCEYLYKTTDYWRPELERCLLWSDPALGINWPILGEPLMAAKDAAGLFLREADLYQ